MYLLDDQSVTTGVVAFAAVLFIPPFVLICVS